MIQQMGRSRSQTNPARARRVMLVFRLFEEGVDEFKDGERKKKNYWNNSEELRRREEEKFSRLT